MFEQANKQYYSAWYNQGDKSCDVDPEMNRWHEASEEEAPKPDLFSLESALVHLGAGLR